jgi:hypothetical protein
MLCESVTRLPLFQMLNVQLPLAHLVMEILRYHTQQKLLSYSDKVQMVTFLMCIPELKGKNVPRETDGHHQTIQANTKSVTTVFVSALFPVYPFKPRIKSHLLFAGIIRSSPFSPR